MNAEATGRARAVLAKLIDTGPDMTGAACSTTDSSLWFPEKGYANVSRTAVTMCKGGMLGKRRVPECPVRRLCLERALDTRAELTHYGIWAGYSGKKLSRMRNLRKALLRAYAPLKRGVTSDAPTTEGATHEAA